MFQKQAPRSQGRRSSQCSLLAPPRSLQLVGDSGQSCYELMNELTKAPTEKYRAGQSVEIWFRRLARKVGGG